LVRTLGSKLRLSNPRVYARFGATLETPLGPRKGLEVRVDREGKRPLVARWGGVSLRWRIDAVLDDRPPHAWNARTEVLERLLADTCELCGSRDRVQVHHVRHLSETPPHCATNGRFPSRSTRTSNPLRGPKGVSSLAPKRA